MENERELKEHWCQENADFCHSDGTNEAIEEVKKIMEEECTTIKDELKAYLNGEINFQEFYEWFMEETWDLDPSYDEYELSNHIRLLHAEYTSFTRDGKRHRSEESLKEEFARLV